MDVLVTGAAGMLGRKLADRISAVGEIAGKVVNRLTLLDVVTPPAPKAFTGVCNSRSSDLTAAGEAESCLASRPDMIFHLAAIVSGEAEANFEKGYGVNLDGTRLLFDAIRRVGDAYCPRVVFASSVAVYGPPFPAVVLDDFCTTPQSSYGTQKMMSEAILSDYSRRGLMDGIAIRLPTICIRPGKPNQAASGFFSGIMREPLIGEEATLPVEDSVRCWVASPRAAIGFLMHAANIDLALLGARRALMLPGLSVSVGEQIATLRRVAGNTVASRIRRLPDARVAAIVSAWPERFDTARANALGFRAESDFETILRTHINDELGGSIL